jgi:branched-chain amino acid transport system substrate-binding protein
LAASSAAAVRSYVAYVNSKGGVCGRKVALKEADDGSDNSRYRSIVTELGPKVFGLTGGFAVGDVGGADIVEAQKLPTVTLPSSDVLQSVSTVFDINPPYKNLNAPVGKYTWLREHGATKASVIYLDVDQSRLEAKNHISLIKAAGIQVVQEQPLPVSTLSYDSAARNVANSGADYMLFIGTVDADISMAQSLANTDHKLKWPEYFIFSYETNFVSGAGANAEGAITWIRWLPNEESSKNAELERFLEWMGRVAPGEPTDTFAADSWASSKAFFDSLEALPGPITREAIVAQLRSVKTYDAAGMFGDIELGGEKSNACVVGLQVVSGKWKRLTPTGSGFLC